MTSTASEILATRKRYNSVLLRSGKTGSVTRFDTTEFMSEEAWRRADEIIEIMHRVP
jgi:hypothetical protein